MSFLTPLFLAGLAALAIPVFVHLVQRDRSQVLRFPSLMFIQRIPYKSVQRRKIEHWLVLLLRCAALILLVLAFARPFMQRSAFAAGGGLGPRELVVLVDRSYSMAYGDRWERARDAARDAIAGMGPEDRGSVVLFASGAEAAARSTADPNRLRGALDDAEVGWEVTRFGPALKLAQSILEESRLPNREVVLVSDLQRIGWTGDEGVRLPEGTRFTIAPILDGEAPNRSVTVGRVDRERVREIERITVTARVVQSGASAAAEVPVALEIDGREVQRKSVTVDAEGAETVTFDPLTLDRPFTRGTVRIEEDALPRDDAAYFVVSPGEAIRIVVAEHPRARPEESLYLERALGIVGDSPFEVVRLPSAGLSADRLAGASLVVLNDVDAPGGGGGDRLREFVEEGGGLLVIAGDHSNGGSLPGILPENVGEPVDRPGSRGARLGYVDFSHPVFEIFSRPGSGDFSSARFYRTRGVQPDSGDQVLARFDDGAPALIERTVGEGHVLLWASTFDTFWNDLALQPVFLPFVHQLVMHLGGRAERSSSFTAGEVLDLKGPQGPGLEEEVDEIPALSPSGRQSEIPVGETAFLPLREGGFYEVRRPGVRDERPFAVAVNVDLAESELTPMDAEELETAVTAGPVDGTLIGSAELGPEEREARQGLWRFLLLGALGLLALESVIANRLSRVAR